MKRVLILIALLALGLGGGALYFAQKADSDMPTPELISVEAENVGP